MLKATNYEAMRNISILFIVFFTIHSLFGQDINIGYKDSLHSTILQENRPLSIYLPPSYFTEPKQNYPVLYILDGEYNFRYVAGILELQAGIAENIPEMILVAISGKGSKKYKENCKPFIQDVEDSGNADEVLNFIEKELIPYIDSKYRTYDYRILSGHSIGGLFIINAALKKPTLFQSYIAISPALWWEENAINTVAKNTYEKKSATKANVYVSLANEKGMGVEKFLKLVGPEFKFKEFDNENHNSVGAPTYEWALKDIFEIWKVDKTYFDSSEELKEYNQKVVTHYNYQIPIADGVLYNTVIYILKDKAKELEKVKTIIDNSYPNSKPYLISLLASNLIKSEKYEQARIILENGLIENPNSFELYEKLAEVDLKQDKIQQFKEDFHKAINLAKAQKVRQWRIDEIKDLSEMSNQ